MSTKTFFIFFILAVTVLNAQSYYYNNHKKIILKPLDGSKNLQNRSASDPDEILYYEQDSKVLGVSNQIIVKCVAIDRILAKYDVTLIREISNHIYLLKVKQSSLTLEMANKLYEDKDVVYAHPNFIRAIEKR